VIFLSGSESMQVFFIVCLYVLPKEIKLSKETKKEGWGVPLSGLTPPHVCACPKPEPGFPSSYVVVFLCLVREGER